MEVAPSPRVLGKRKTGGEIRNNKYKTNVFYVPNLMQWLDEFILSKRWGFAHKFLFSLVSLVLRGLGGGIS